MLHIALIDDKSYGLEQIHELHMGTQYELEYFESFKKFQEDKKIYDIVYLDYYLEKDGITGDMVLPQVQQMTQKVIGFSSVERCNEMLKKLGADDTVLKL